MKELMEFSSDIIDELSAEEMIFIKGGTDSEVSQQANNSSGTCIGVNDGSGVCTAENNSATRIL